MPSTTIRKLTLGEFNALVAGLPKYCPNAIFTVAGQTFTTPQAVTFITSVLDSVAAVASAKSGLTDARLAEAKVLTDDGATVRGIRDTVETMFSNNTTVLEAFAIAPRKVRQPLSAAARAAATAKAAATRLARGTESKKQKALISGNVAGVTITPFLRPSATPTASSSPSPTTGSTATQPSPVVSPVVAPVVSPVAAGTAAVSTTAPSPVTPATGGVAHS